MENFLNPPKFCDDEKRLYHIICLDRPHDGWYFLAPTALQAMQSLIYYLNISHVDKESIVNMYGGGRTLSVTHNGLTYSCLNDWYANKLREKSNNH